VKCVIGDTCNDLGLERFKLMGSLNGLWIGELVKGRS
jgi:hypothetical protein